MDMVQLKQMRELGQTVIHALIHHILLYICCASRLKALLICLILLQVLALCKAKFQLGSNRPCGPYSWSEYIAY